MPSQIGWDASIAVEDIRNGHVGKARRRYNATFGLGFDSRMVVKTFQAIFADAAVGAALEGDVLTFQRLHATCVKLWGDKKTWELFRPRLLEAAEKAKHNNRRALRDIRHSLVDSRPAGMTTQTAYHIFWRQTGIKVRHLPKQRKPSSQLAYA